MRRPRSIFAIAKGATEPVVWFHSDEMSQPNDITIARDGSIYASDPNWKGRDGHIWRIARAADGSVQGEIMTAPRAMGTTSGIDLSPDGKTLYVGESSNGQVWSYAIRGNELTDAKLVKAFQPDTIDGLRTDVTGRLYVARILKGTIVLMKPSGVVEREIALKGKEPTNLAFGGSDGKTVFVPNAKAASSNPSVPTSRVASTASSAGVAERRGRSAQSARRRNEGRLSSCLLLAAVKIKTPVTPSKRPRSV